MNPDLIKRPCTIHNVTGQVDEWGEPGSQITASVETSCYFEQKKAVEVTQGQETYWTDAFAAFLPGETIGASSLITVGGAVFEVVGKPNSCERPDLTVSHIEVDLLEVTSS